MAALDLHQSLWVLQMLFNNMVDTHLNKTLKYGYSKALETPAINLQGLCF